MKRAIFALAVLALALVGGAAAYQAVAQRNYSMLLTRGDSALRDDQTFNAIEAYSGAIALRPDSMLAYLRRGQTYQRRGDRGDLEAAARDFRTAASLDPAATRPLEALGDVLFQLQQYARAVATYERCRPARRPLGARELQAGARPLSRRRHRRRDRGPQRRASPRRPSRRRPLPARRLPPRAGPRARRARGAREGGRAVARPDPGARGARRSLRRRSTATTTSSSSCR